MNFTISISATKGEIVDNAIANIVRIRGLPTGAFVNLTEVSNLDAPVVDVVAEVRALLVAARAPGGNNKIPLIKGVRSITGLGLKEAKDLVEAAGYVSSNYLG